MATTRIEAKRLIPGRGDVIGDGIVVFDGPLLGYAGPVTGAPETPDATVVSTDTVMPGLWECHGHFIARCRLLQSPPPGFAVLPPAAGGLG